MSPRRHPGMACGCGLCAGSRAAHLWRQSVIALMWAAGLCVFVVEDEKTGMRHVLEAAT